MCENLIGSYAFEKNENFDEFLSQMGVPLIPRKVMCTIKPGVTISKDGDRWTVTFKVLIKNFNLTFELGKEFEEDNPVSGEKNKASFKLDSFFLDSFVFKIPMYVLEKNRIDIFQNHYYRNTNK